jgi:hypothetical protein
VFKAGSLECTLNSILWIAGKIRHNVNAIAETRQARVKFATRVIMQLLYFTINGLSFLKLYFLLKSSAFWDIMLIAACFMMVSPVRPEDGGDVFFRNTD